jgi:hypothetical protein
MATFAERHQALLAALAEGAQHAFVEADFVQLQIDQFGDAQAGGVERFQHGAVAQAERGVEVGGVEQAADLFFRHDLGQARGRAGLASFRVGSATMRPRPSCQR